MKSDSPVDCQSRGLDRAKQLFLPQAKMQTNLRRITAKSPADHRKKQNRRTEHSVRRCFSDFCSGAMLSKGQRHGVKQGGANVKEMAIQQAAQQKHTCADTDEQYVLGGLAQQEPNGLGSVQKVSAQTDNAGGGQKLHKSIVPAGREEGGKGFHIGILVQLHVQRIECAAKPGMLGKLLDK